MATVYSGTGHLPPRFSISDASRVNAGKKNVISLQRHCNNLSVFAPKNTIPIHDFSLAATKSTAEDVGNSFEGVTFSDIGESISVVKMSLENGSSAKLMLPSGLITSFKSRMWHGATVELLHTTVSSDNGNPVIQGGLSLALDVADEDDEDHVSWSPDSWALHRVEGTPQESLQVELVGTSSSSNINAQVKHIITLGQDLLTSEIQVSNNSSRNLHLTGSDICHLAVSTPDAAYALGLQGSDFFRRSPFVANYSIVPPDFDRPINGRDAGKFWVNKLFARNWDNTVEGDSERDMIKELEGEGEGEEEEDNYKHLTVKLCGIYTNAPRDLTIIDRGRRNSVTVRRNGFKELYMLSPGSEHEWYGKYSYICIGHAALGDPVIVCAQSEWRGGMQLWNPNS